VGDAAQLDLVVVGHEQLAARSGDERLAEHPPSSLRTGMLCRLGWSDDSRPVRATVWLKVAWMRPSAADLGEQALAVGGAQLLDLAVAQQVLDDRVLAAQLLERLRRRWSSRSWSSSAG
jgi:hypothetical protein